jgi:cell division protein FtsZ
MLIKPKAGEAARIKVLGIGGGGGNAVNSIIKDGGITGVEFISINTDAQALLKNKADTKIQIGENLTKGLGSGGDPEIGRQAAEESKDKIKEEIEGADMVFLSCGEGGGTGTGASPVIAQIAKELGVLTIAVVTKPFEFEGSKRRLTAEEGIDKLKEVVDTLIIVPNHRILQVVDKNTPILEAFKKIDSVLHQAIKSIAELIVTPGLINVDFADVKTIMSNAGTALLAIGTASGEKRALTAIKQAISSPLLDVSTEGAKGILFNITGGTDLTMAEIDEAASIITKTVNPDADIIFGAVIDEQMMDQIKITIIATKFSDQKLRFGKFPKITSPTEEIKTKGETGEEKKLKTDFDEDLIDEDSEFEIPTFLRKK